MVNNVELWTLALQLRGYQVKSLPFILAFVLLAGTIIFITVPALYNRFEDGVDRYAGMIHRKFSKHYKVVDENVISRLPRNLPRDKDL